MSVPAGLLDFFAAIMLGVTAVSAARLFIARRADPDTDVDVAHLLMGIAMAGTLTASLSTLPAVAWEIIFGALTLWFAYRVTREYRSGRGLRALVSEHHAPHLLHSAAMLYMFLALHPAPGRTASAMAAMSPAGQALRLPTVALAFAFLLCGYVVADLDRVPAPRALTRLTSPAPTPPLALAGVPASTGVPPSTGVSAPAAAPTPADISTPAATPTPVAAPAAPTASAPVATPASGAAQGTGAHAVLLSPQVARGCRIAMGVTMAFMLIIMI